MRESLHRKDQPELCSRHTKHTPPSVSLLFFMTETLVNFEVLSLWMAPGLDVTGANVIRKDVIKPCVQRAGASGCPLLAALFALPSSPMSAVLAVQTSPILHFLPYLNNLNNLCLDDDHDYHHDNTDHHHYRLQSNFRNFSFQVIRNSSTLLVFAIAVV